MNNYFTYPREKFDEGVLDRKLITQLISKHRNSECKRLKQNMDYYMGEHKISSDVEKKLKTVCNHAKDISDTASGYFLGSPISYDYRKGGKAGQKRLQKLIDAFEKAETEDADQDHALQLSIYGCSYEYNYIAEGESYLKTKVLSPENTFIVYDDTIEQKELFGVYYYVKRDDANNREKYVAMVATDTHLYNYILYPISEIENEEDIDIFDEPKGKEHLLGSIPILEYKNNKFCIGDFEQQIELIDAYNALMSDRVNDKEQFIDAILVIYGALLGDNKEESQKAHKELKKEKVLELAEDAKAEYLTRTFDENGVETLRNAIKEDIYTLSHVPNLTDEKFAGNSSGVAMEYKLLGLEMLTKIKERYYRKGLKKRINLFCYFLNLKSSGLDPNMIKSTFSRALPQNLIELANLIATLSDKVSLKTLIKLLPFVENPDEEVEAVKAEKDEALQRQKSVFEQKANTKLEEELDDDE